MRIHPIAFVLGLLAIDVAHAQPEAPDPHLPATSLDARVVHVDGQFVTIDSGATDGVVSGAHVAFVGTSVTDLGDGEIAVSDPTFAVGEVVAVSRGRARVRIGLNEDVPLGTRAIGTEGPLTRSLVAPPESRAKSEFAIGMRVVSTVGARGGGVLVDARLERRIGAHIRLRLRVDPTGAIRYRFPDPDFEGPEVRPPASSATVANVIGLISYDTGLVEMGAGLGLTTTTRIDETHVACADCAPTERHLGRRAGLTVASTARFGPRDGLFLEVDTAFVAIRSRIEMSRFAARLNVPVTRALSFIFAGSSGFGVVGTRIVDVGARMLVHGSGHAGSLFVTPTIGYAAIAERAALETTASVQDRPRVSVLVHGASAGVSIERRF